MQRHPMWDVPLAWHTADDGRATGPASRRTASARTSEYCYVHNEPTGLTQEHTVADAAEVLAAEDMRDYAIFALDANGHVVSWNDGAARMKGYETDEVIGLHFSAFFPDQKIATGFPKWELEQSAERGFWIDRGWRVRKDGSTFWAHAVIIAQRDLDGQLDGFIKVTRDESETHVRQRRSNRRFVNLFELAPVGIARFDETDRILDANGALCDLLGYPLRDIRNRHGRELLHTSDHGGVVAARPGMTSGDGTQPMQHRVMARADGQPVLCQVHSGASVLDDGSPSWLVVFHDITAQVRHTEMLRYQATHDQTTGLLNRAGAEELLSSLLQPHNANKIAALFCDLDNFKRVNDSLGHAAGDELLWTIAQRLTDELPSICTPARYYGDEFLIICSDIEQCGGPDGLTETVNNLLEASVTVRDRTVHVSASIGATIVNDTNTTVAEIVRTADRAMFQAKPPSVGNGKGTHGVDQLAVEEDLRHAIQTDQLPLHYQPIIDNAGHVVFTEALLRWSHPEYGRLTPDVVLNIAENGGLLVELDRCVLRTALRESTKWRDSAGNSIAVSVNLSGLNPSLTGFVDDILAAIDDAGAHPEDLVLEMVETILAGLGPQPLQAMTELANRGVRFAMDDFGTGNSSLARLKDLPTQILKLDRKFVTGLGKDATDLGISRTVIELARVLGRTCIAEGVENTTQRHLLHVMGTDAYQGYLYSPALPPEELPEYLRSTPITEARD